MTLFYNAVLDTRHVKIAAEVTVELNSYNQYAGENHENARCLWWVE